MRIKKITQSPLKYLKSFIIEYLDKNGSLKTWEMVSRDNLYRLKQEIKGKVFSDGAMIVAMNKEKTNLIMIKEYRPVANKYIYSFPAGLSDNNEDIKKTSAREFKEETGLDFIFLGKDNARYTSVGLSNERVNTVYGYYSGEISRDFLEESEDITAFKVDRNLAINLLKNEDITARASFVLRYFFDLGLY